MPQAPPPHYQAVPQPPTQQSSIQIPVGSALPKVVSTACIYPSQPGQSQTPVPDAVWSPDLLLSAGSSSGPPPPQPQPRPPAAVPAPPPSGPTPSNRPPWVCDPNFADKYDPTKTTTTTTVKVPPLPQGAPPPPAYIPTPSPAVPSPAPIAHNPAPFSPVARGVAQRAERFAASSRTPLCGACNSVIR